MDIQKIVVTTFKSILFTLIAVAMTLPILLSVPGLSNYVKNALSMIGIGAGN